MINNCDGAALRGDVMFFAVDDNCARAADVQPSSVDARH